MRRLRIAERGCWIGLTVMCAVMLAVAILSAPMASDAQQGGQLYRLGVLRPTAPLSVDDEARLPTALRHLGYIEKQNLAIERRYASGKMDQLPALAHELVHGRMDVNPRGRRSGRPSGKGCDHHDPDHHVGPIRSGRGRVRERVSHGREGTSLAPLLRQRVRWRPNACSCCEKQCQGRHALQRSLTTPDYQRR